MRWYIDDRQYEKPVSSKRTVQRTSAMGENIKHQILSQDMIRRLKNTSESLGGAAKVRAVDQYSQKLRNSGYMRDQIARIITNGVKGYEGMRRRRIKEGRALKCTATKSRMSRRKQRGSRRRKEQITKEGRSQEIRGRVGTRSTRIRLRRI